MSILEEVQQAVERAAAEVGPSVLSVGRGAGFVVGPDRIVTNAHNLLGPRGPDIAGHRLDVHFADGHVASAEVVGADVDGDLAVLSVPTGEVSVPPWAETGPALGAAVFALGAPRRGPARVTVGFVCGVERSFRGPRGRRLLGIEHTAPVGRGSSGGPVVDREGRIVGIDTHRRGDGFYLAVPVSTELRQRLERLGRGEAPARRRLGVAVAPPQVAARLRAAVGLSPRDGVLLRAVDDGGAAARAGLREGDLVTAAAGAAVRGPDDLLDALDRSEGDLVLAVFRGETELALTVVFDPTEDD